MTWNYNEEAKQLERTISMNSWKDRSDKFLTFKEYFHIPLLVICLLESKTAFAFIGKAMSGIRNEFMEALLIFLVM